MGGRVVKANPGFGQVVAGRVAVQAPAVLGRGVVVQVDVVESDFVIVVDAAAVVCGVSAEIAVGQSQCILVVNTSAVIGVVVLEAIAGQRGGGIFAVDAAAVLP